MALPTPARFRVILLGLLFVGSCSQPAPPPGDRGAGNAAATAAAENEARGSAQEPSLAAGGSTDPSPNYQDAMVPEADAKCDFEERDPADRPRSFVAASHSSNIIFYQRPGGPLWSDIDPNGAIAELEANELIVAARYRMPDLWIRPKAGRVTLEAGERRLTCY